jgi:hypothetical protein
MCLVGLESLPGRHARRPTPRCGSLSGHSFGRIMALPDFGGGQHGSQKTNPAWRCRLPPHQDADHGRPSGPYENPGGVKAGCPAASKSMEIPKLGNETTISSRIHGIQDQEAGLWTKFIFWLVKRRIGHIPLSVRIRATIQNCWRCRNG